jgi:PTH1 family peptidyl-tRNA hydrolase
MNTKKIFCFIGLGNKGDEYSFTRHNFGKDFLIWVSKEELIKFEDYKYFQKAILENEKYKFIFIIPNFFMNESGKIFLDKDIFKNNPIFIILHDDLQIEFGKFAFRNNKDRGERGHNGLRSIKEYFLQFSPKECNNLPLYFSLGIGRPKENISAGDFVLKKFNNQEKEILFKNFNNIYDGIKKICLQYELI